MLTTRPGSAVHLLIDISRIERRIFIPRFTGVEDSYRDGRCVPPVRAVRYPLDAVCPSEVADPFVPGVQAVHPVRIGRRGVQSTTERAGQLLGEQVGVIAAFAASNLDVPCGHGADGNGDAPQSATSIRPAWHSVCGSCWRLRWADWGRSLEKGLCAHLAVPPRPRDSPNLEACRWIRQGPWCYSAGRSPGAWLSPSESCATALSARAATMRCCSHPPTAGTRIGAHSNVPSREPRWRLAGQ